MRITTGFALAAALAAAASAQPQPDPLPRSEPAPFGALLSADAALKVVFDKVCLPAILEGRSIEAMALANHLLEVSAKSAGATPQDRAWRLASLGDVYVVAWADGSCTSSVERGDPGEMKRLVLEAMKARGVVMNPGAVAAARDNGVRTAWCSEGPKPWVLAITTRGEGRSRRPAILTTLFKARGDAPSFCRAGPLV